MTPQKPTDTDLGRYLVAEEKTRLLKLVEERGQADLAQGRAQGVRVWASMELALFTGARLIELTKLNCGDVRLTKGREEITVFTAKRREDMVRVIPLSPRMVKLLKLYLRWKKNKGEGIEPHDPLVCSKRGGRLSREGWKKMFTRTLERYGMVSPGRKDSGKMTAAYSIKAARHTVGMERYRQTKDLLLTQRWMGHAGPQTTARYYAQATLEDMKNAVKDDE